MPTAGPNNPSANSGGGAGDVGWVSPGNAYTSDNAYMTADGGFTGGLTDILRLTGFGFSVPGGATINGITVEIERKSSGVVTDATVRLLKAGTETGSNKASASGWPPADAYATYGGAADLWGTTWTAAQINAGTFGVSLSANLDVVAAASVDHVRVTVTYTAAAAASHNALALTGVG
jgi:hypothetical protein